MFITVANKNVEIHFSSKVAGHGAWDVLCTVQYGGNNTVITKLTTDSSFIDTLSDMRADDASHEDVQNFFAEKFLNDRLEDDIQEWLENLEN